MLNFQSLRGSLQHAGSRCELRRGADRSWKLLTSLVHGKKEYFTFCIAETCSVCLSDIEDTVDDQLIQQKSVLPECGHSMHERSLQCLIAVVQGKA